MQNNSFNRFALVLTAATAGAEATPGEVSASAPAPAKEKKAQHTITVTEADKGFLKDLQAEFYGPQASNKDGKRFLSTEEAFHVLLEVAKNHRIAPRLQAEDENGEPVFDNDGQPVMAEPEDRFATEAQKLIDAREFGRSTPSAKVSELEAKIAALQAELAKRGGVSPVEA